MSITELGLTENRSFLSASFSKSEVFVAYIIENYAYFHSILVLAQSERSCLSQNCPTLSAKSLLLATTKKGQASFDIFNNLFLYTFDGFCS